jgi:hypothetical protein
MEKGRKMKKLLLFVSSLFVSTLLLTACGGGSSGGGGTFVGTYSGTGNVVVSSPGVPSQSGAIALTVTVNADGSVIVRTGPNEEFNGTISGNTFTANLPGSVFNEPGLTCTGTITARGNGSGNTFTGNFSGTAVCNGVTFNFSGTFTVTRVSSRAPSATRSGLSELVRQAAQ